MRYLIVGFLCLLVTSAAPIQGQNTCHVADRHSAVFLANFRGMMAASGAGLRTKFSLPLVPASEITLVADSATCARAGQAADSVMSSWDPTDPPIATTAPLYVIKIGTSYAVVDLSDPDPNDEYASVFVFGPAWVYRGILAM